MHNAAVAQLDQMLHHSGHSSGVVHRDPNFPLRPPNHRGHHTALTQQGQPGIVHKDSWNDKAVHLIQVCVFRLEHATRVTLRDQHLLNTIEENAEVRTAGCVGAEGCNPNQAAFTPRQLACASVWHVTHSPYNLEHRRAGTFVDPSAVVEYPRDGADGYSGHICNFVNGQFGHSRELPGGGDTDCKVKL